MMWRHTNWSSTTSGSILLCTRATTRLTIDGPTGNVGIGTTNTISRLTIKSDYSNENTGICINEQDANTYNLKIYPYVQGTSQVGYKFKVNNIALSTETLIFYYNDNAAFNYNLNCADLTLGEVLTFKNDVWIITNANGTTLLYMIYLVI
jgi:hypothetical protein